jgi:hypothetical protein
LIAGRGLAFITGVVNENIFLLLNILITIVLWAVIISGAWWVGITVSAKNELTPQQRIDEAFEALKGGLAD